MPPLSYIKIPHIPCSSLNPQYNSYITVPVILGNHNNFFSEMSLLFLVLCSLLLLLLLLKYNIPTEKYTNHTKQVNKTQISPQPVPPIRKLPQASYPYPSEGRQNENHSHRKLPNWSHGSQLCLTQGNYELCRAVSPKTDGSWWRVLTKRGPLEKGIGNHFSILALRTLCTVWKGKTIGHWKISSPGR